MYYSSSFCSNRLCVDEILFFPFHCVPFLPALAGRHPMLILSSATNNSEHAQLLAAGLAMTTGHSSRILLNAVGIQILKQFSTWLKCRQNMFFFLLCSPHSTHRRSPFVARACLSATHANINVISCSASKSMWMKCSCCCCCYSRSSTSFHFCLSALAENRDSLCTFVACRWLFFFRMLFARCRSGFQFAISLKWILCVFFFIYICCADEECSMAAIAKNMY